MSRREEIIELAADLIHQYGYNNLGIQKIVEEAGIPKGSFYHYFSSKEDLGLAVVDYFIVQTKGIFSQFDKSISGLKGFFLCYAKRLEELQYQRGCPIGNLVLELADINENFRIKLLEWTTYLEREIYEILSRSNLNTELDRKLMSSFIVSAFEGATLKTKLEKCRKPYDEFMHFVFEILLK